MLTILFLYLIVHYELKRKRNKRRHIMSLSLISKPVDRPVIATITGDAGVGKTVLAATFPKPIFIRVEDGLQSVPVDIRPDAFPVINSHNDIWEQLTTLIKEEHEYKTVVIDSITQLEQLFGQHIVESDPKKPKSLAQAMGGYGAGYVAVGALHGRIRKAAQLLNNKGMHVVFIAHSDVTTIELPDSDPYSRYDIRLHKKSMSHYTDNVDLIAYIKLQMFTQGDGDRKKAISNGERIAVCYTSAAQISKNRYGITTDLPVVQNENPFTNYITGL